MPNLYIIAEDSQSAAELCQGLAQSYACSVVSDAGEIIDRAAGEPDAAVLLEGSSYSRIGELSRRVKRERDLPVIALVATLDGAEGQLYSVDDFMVRPWNLRELDLRIRRRLRRTSSAGEGEVVKCGDLTIDLAGYEVFVGGSPVVLTFKEYELLRFLASNPDRVFTRQALLNKVWGYDYYGGDRTVDVHIQRLRSKIEGSKHVQIETVRNIGYRLRADQS